MPASMAMITEHHGAKMAALWQLLLHWFQFDFRNGTSNKQPAGMAKQTAMALANQLCTAD